MFKSEEFECRIIGDFAQFTDPLTKGMGEKVSYQVPTYEALKGIIMSIYWKPTIVYFVDSVRIVNKIDFCRISSTFKNKIDTSGSCLSIGNYTKLRNVEYRVRFHYEWSDDERYIKDQNENKHSETLRRYLKKGGRKTPFLGESSCRCYVFPYSFDEDGGYYDDSGDISFGLMYHSMNYYDKHNSKLRKGENPLRPTPNYDNIVMCNGVINFNTPDKCAIKELGGVFSAI